jgi:hypothetical protein
MRTARSMTSGENFGDFLMMAPSSQTKEPPQKAGRFSLANSASKRRSRRAACRLEGAALARWFA